MMRTTTALAAAATLALALAVAPVAAEDQLGSEQAAALAVAMPRSPLASDAVYMVMTDRYANGDSTNDQGDVGIAAGLADGGFDATRDGYFHGGDLKGLTANLDRIRRLGFTALWITPPFVNRAVQGSSAGYHGYWILDFTNIDPHLGTKADFAAMVQRAHQLGLKVYVDIVLNHTADVITYDDFTSFGTPGSKKPYIPTGLASAKGPAFLNDLANYHNQGNIANWSDPDQYRNGDFFGLDDIRTEAPAVVQGFAEVYADWLVEYGIDGFRIDTVKHVDEAFMAQWLQALRAALVRKAAAKGVPVPQPQMFGEVYTAEVPQLSAYMRDKDLPSLLDFGLQPAVAAFAGGDRGASAIADVVAQDDLYNAGTGSDGYVRNAYGLAVFGGNHDMGRIALMVANEGGSTQLLARTKLAYSILYLLRGAPVVYYGDEVGMIGSGGDKAARQDMFPTRVGEWQQEDRLGAKPIGRNSSLTAAAEALPMAQHLRALNGLRARYPALRDGTLVVRRAQGQVLAWSRIDAKERREFLLLANAGNKVSQVIVSTSTPGARFATVFGAKGTWQADAKGAVRIPVPARSTLVLRAGSLLPATSSAPTAMVTATYDRSAGTGLFTARVPAGRDPVSVTFVARACASCEWQALGTDDAAPYRLPVPAALAWGAEGAVEVAAITRTSDGRTAAGSVVRVLRATVSAP